MKIIYMPFGFFVLVSGQINVPLHPFQAPYPELNLHKYENLMEKKIRLFSRLQITGFDFQILDNKHLFQIEFTAHITMISGNAIKSLGLLNSSKDLLESII